MKFFRFRKMDLRCREWVHLSEQKLGERLGELGVKAIGIGKSGSWKRCDLQMHPKTLPHEFEIRLLAWDYRTRGDYFVRWTDNHKEFEVIERPTES